MSKSDEFKIKELCWAKIKGFPWWPALIREIRFRKLQFEKMERKLQFI